MQYTLLDYQQDAVRETLQTLTRCRDDWHAYQERNAFALSSTTGSGKTVIAATVIEALLHGSGEFDFDPVPGAVVLWVSKDPALNLQTRSRIIQSADRIPVGDIVLLDKDYADQALRAGHLYFINPDKLSKNALFVRKTNERDVTFWDIINNTIRDGSKTLYLILDEAHEGTKPRKKADAEEAQTIVMRIINGNGSNQAVPIVWGISATVERFNKAMEAAQGRATKPNIVIDPKRIQESGLLKNTLVLDIPDEDGDFETTFIRDAALEFAEVCKRWDTYTDEQGIEPVAPLLVVQIPNKERSDGGTDEEDRLIRNALDTIQKHWPDFAEDGIAHVMDRPKIEVGAYEIPRVAAQDIQADTRIRILIAKDAVSTGWDCPRAEVLVSLRPGKDATYITQLLGRMVRTPLARLTSDDRLNSAACYLPHFDRSTAKRVAEIIMGLRAPDSGGSGGAEPAGPKVLLRPVDLTWNPKVPIEVKELLESLPSFPKPAQAPKPIKRLLKAAQAFGQDELVAHANDAAHKRLYGVLDGLAARYKDEVASQTKAIMTADIRRFTAKRLESVDESADTRDADVNTIKDALKHTRRVLSASVINGYLRRDIETAVLKDPFNAPINEIQAGVAALSRIETASGEPGVVETVEDAADALVKNWLTSKRDDIALLPESRQSVYNEIRALASDPEDTPPEIPADLRVDTVDLDRNLLPTAPLHVLSDAHGEFPLDIKHNPDELAVIAHESSKNSVVGWYRNPDQATKNALRVAYKKDDIWRNMQPDFIFVQRNAEGTLVPSIVDPHGTYLSDAMPKLLGLSAYAEEHGNRYSRIESLASVGGELRMLDLKDPTTREAIRSAHAAGTAAGPLFSGSYSQAYHP